MNWHSLIRGMLAEENPGTLRPDHQRASASGSNRAVAAVRLRVGEVHGRLHRPVADARLSVARAPRPVVRLGTRVGGDVPAGEPVAQPPADLGRRNGSGARSSQGMVAVNSVQRVTAIESGILVFDHVFLPYMLTDNGQTVAERIGKDTLLIEDAAGGAVAA